MPKPTPTKHILVYADDDEDDLLLVKDALLPYADVLDVRLFNDGYGVYNFLLEQEKTGQKPCLVILDINMPAMSGTKLLPMLRSVPFFDDVPVILFTTSSMDHDYRFAQKHNAGFITKPMTYAQIDTTVAQFLSYCSDELKERIKGTDAAGRQ